MCDCPDRELEPGEAERIAGLFAFGMLLADLITHPEGARELMSGISPAAERALIGDT